MKKFVFLIVTVCLFGCGTPGKGPVTVDIPTKDICSREENGKTIVYSCNKAK